MDLDALMADLSSIEQELSTINSKPAGGGGLARLGLTDTKVQTAARLKGGSPVAVHALTLCACASCRSVRSLQLGAVAGSSQQGAAEATA